MDPNANLREQREIFDRLNAGTDEPDDLERLGELALAMDEWLSGGGFLPRAWAAKRKR